MIEQRRYARTAIQCPLTFTTKGQTGELSGFAKDISIGGMFVETKTPAAFNADVTVHVKLPTSKQTLMLPGRVRWVRSDGMGLQFGLLGAHETHAIIELSRRTEDQ